MSTTDAPKETAERQDGGSPQPKETDSIPAPVNDEDDDFISEEKLRSMSRSEVYELALDAGIEESEIGELKTEKIVDLLLEQFGV